MLAVQAAVMPPVWPRTEWHKDKFDSVAVVIYSSAIAGFNNSRYLDKVVEILKQAARMQYKVLEVSHDITTAWISISRPEEKHATKHYVAAHLEGDKLVDKKARIAIYLKWREHGLDTEEDVNDMVEEIHSYGGSADDIDDFVTKIKSVYE